MRWGRVGCDNNIFAVLTEGEGCQAAIIIDGLEPFFGERHQGTERNPYAKFRQSSSAAYGGDMIKEKIQDG